MITAVNDPKIDGKNENSKSQEQKRRKKSHQYDKIKPLFHGMMKLQRDTEEAQILI